MIALKRRTPILKWRISVFYSLQGIAKAQSLPDTRGVKLPGFLKILGFMPYAHRSSNKLKRSIQFVERVTRRLGYNSGCESPVARPAVNDCCDQICCPFICLDWVKRCDQTEVSSQRANEDAETYDNRFEPGTSWRPSDDASLLMSQDDAVMGGSGLSFAPASEPARNVDSCAQGASYG